MKKLMMLIMLVMVFALMGCGNIVDKIKPTSNEQAEEPGTEQAQNEESEETTEVDADVDEKQDDTESVQEEDVDEDDASTGNMEGLTVQLLKTDEEDGITLENNEIYQAIQSEIEDNPEMGVPDDFSIYPFDIVYFEDGSTSIMFLGINRVNQPIRNMSFDVTLGNQDGDYIFDGTTVDLPEELMGTLEPNGVIPFFVDIDEDGEEIFINLNQNNTVMEIDDFRVDFAD